MTNGEAANKLHRSYKMIQKMVEPYRGSQPEWFGQYRSKTGGTAEYYHPALFDVIEGELTQREHAPEGWMTKGNISKELGRSRHTINRLINTRLEEHPDWSRSYQTQRGSIAEYFHPDLIEEIKRELNEKERAPEGWMNQKALAGELGTAESVPKRLIEPYRTTHPGWFREFLNKAGRPSEYYHPDLVAAIRESIESREPAPEEWMTRAATAQFLNRAPGTIGTAADSFRDSEPEWFKIYKTPDNHMVEHYHPRLINALEQLFTEHAPAPEGWLTRTGIAKTLSYHTGGIEVIVDSYKDSHPEWFGLYRDKTGKVVEHYHPDLVAAIRESVESREPAPEGWMTNHGVALALGVEDGTVNRAVNPYRATSPEWFKRYMNKARGVSEHYHPDLVAEVTDVLKKRMSERSVGKETQAEQERLKGSLRELLSEVSQGESSEAQEFRKLTELFGSERAIDILFQYRPEYKNIPLPYVKSILGDYLGEFLVVRGEFNLETLKSSQEYLSDAGLKEGLTEVVKRDVLHFYNQMKKVHPDLDDQEILSGCIRHLKEETGQLGNADVNEVLGEVETYYRSIFEDIHKPDSLVDRIKGERLFPDINQRINILELASQNKLLIADEMGLGKSASAIVAKETLGVKQALVVVPSNVVDTWRTYLSDARSEEGEQLGYFKPGEAPRVLIVSDYAELQVANPTDYDYVILPQERLTDRYVEQMERFDYDMLVVDEAHKLKNIATGKRAQNLVHLSQKINGAEDRYLALLSGTPVPNKVGDVAMTLKLLYPEKFEQVSDTELTNQILKGDVLDLRSLLVPRMQMKELGESIEMPELHHETHTVQLSQQERDIYEVLLEEDELLPTQKMQYLRQFILNPRLLDATPEIVGSKTTDVGGQLQRTFTDKNKVVMFVNGYVEGVIRGENTIFEDMELPQGVALRRIDGMVDQYERMMIQRELQHPDARMLLAVSGQTADVGVDFSSADEVFFYNEPWTEYEKRQELHRVFRPGLQGELTSRTFIADGTIEAGIHEYTQTKYVAVEKLLRGIPISELEQELLREDEKQADPNLEVNPELARYYFSSWDTMMRIYGHVRELGEENFVEFLSKYGEIYAGSYVDAGSRSYQANANRLSGTLIDRFTQERGQQPAEVKIVDLASGPEMLRRHIPDEYADSVVSIDINANHFVEQDERHVVGSFLQTPLADSSVDYANLALALHYTSFVPSRGNYERVEALQEMNRILKVGGRSVISLMHTSDFRDLEGFRGIAQRLGFKVVDEYSGEVESGSNFKSRIITLEKEADTTESTKEFVQDVGASGLQGLKFSKKDSTMRDTRKIATAFSFDNGTQVPARFNQTDEQVLEEEQEVTAGMEALKSQHGLIESIPREEIMQSGFARVFNGRRYVLFKRLTTGPGAVVVR